MINEINLPYGIHLNYPLKMTNANKIIEFLDRQTHMVIATTGNGIPEAALVGFASTSEFTLIFGTKTNSRKYKNIEQNPHVAIVFDDDKNITVQYEGIASTLSDTELTQYKELYFLKTPTSKKYENQPNQIYLKVLPSWIRYTNYQTNPNEIFEITL